MTADRPSPLTFTKLVVDDLDAMASYYCSVFGLHRATRERFEKGAWGEPIEEIALATAPGEPWGALSLLRFESRDAPPSDEVILGFTTSDLPPLLDRIERAGGTVAGPIQDFPDHGIRAAFARDPEGHLAELVEVRA